LKLTRRYQEHRSPGRYITLKADDELLLMCDLENLARLNESENLNLSEERYLKASASHKDGEDEADEKSDTSAMEERVFVELLMLPGAVLLGKTLGDLRNFMLQDVIQ